MLPETTLFAFQPIGKTLERLAVLLDLHADSLELLHNARDLEFQSPDSIFFIRRDDYFATVPILDDFQAARQNMIVIESHPVFSAFLWVHLDNRPQLRRANQQRPNQQVNRFTIREAHQRRILGVDLFEHFVHDVSCELLLFGALLSEFGVILVTFHLFGHFAAGHDLVVFNLNFVWNKVEATSLLAFLWIHVFFDLARGDVD